MKTSVNLIPASILTARARRRRRRAWIVADVLLGGAGALALIWLHPQASGRVERLRGEHQEMSAALQSEQQRLASTSGALREARAREAVARRIGARPDFSGLLQVLGQAMDSKTFLEQVIIAPEMIGIPGAAGPQGGQAALESTAPGGAASAGAGSAPAHVQYQLLVSGVAVNMKSVNDLLLALDDTGYFSRVWPASTTGRDVGAVHAVEFKIIATLGEGRLADVPEAAPAPGGDAP